MKAILMLLCLSLLTIPLLSIAETPAAGDAILGIWFNAEKDAKIEVYKVDGKYCGKVVWLKNPNDTQGKPKTDIENPDPKLRNRPRLGLVVLTDLKHAGGNSYEKGRIYDPKKGKTYACQAELANPRLLKLRGYIGISLIGRTSEWTRP